MTEALLLLSIGSLLTVCVATLIIAILALRHAQRYVELAEERMENLREEQLRLLILIRKELQRSQEEPEQEHHAQRDDGQKIDELKRELLGLPEVQRESSSSLPAGSSDDTPRARERVAEKTWPTQKVQGARMPPWADTSSKPAGRSPEAKRQRLAVWHPHPDDDVSPERGSTRQTRVQSDAPLKMFHRYYDRYLDNYQGYVKLAERLYMMRDKGEVAPDSAAELEWREKLRRANDGIERTTARLDLLEEYNPELATDDRISRRAGIARHHSELERSR